jgi:hypothetical protein
MSELGVLLPGHGQETLMRDMKKRIEKIHSALDLGFSDYFKDENVRGLTIHNRLEIIEEAVSILAVEEAINFSIF